MLVPVIGLVQVGSQAMADRYTYLPQIGLVFAIVWGCRDLTRSWPARGLICGASAAVVLCLLAVSAGKQTAYWRDAESFWTHNLACTGNNVRRTTISGVLLGKQGWNEEAARHFQQALTADPGFPESYCNLANVLAAQGQVDAAIQMYEKALKIDPSLATVHANLANQLAAQGQVDAAIASYRAALKIDPQLTKTLASLARLLLQMGRLDEAVEQWRELVRIEPSNAKAWEGLGLTLVAQGKAADALQAWRESRRLQPNNSPC